MAIKILPDAFATDPERLARFQREAEVLGALNHPNIAAIYGVDRSSATTALVMELVEGPTLDGHRSKMILGPQTALALTVDRQCVTMSHMKEISIRELHRHTGAWVRNARKYGAILVRDRNTPVATLIPATGEPAVNVFERWKPLKRFAAALDRPVGGTPVEDIVSHDRDR